MDVSGFFTIKEAALAIDKSDQFVRAGIRVGKFNSVLKGNLYLIPSSELERFRKEPFVITRQDLEK